VVINPVAVAVQIRIKDNPNTGRLFSLEGRIHCYAAPQRKALTTEQKAPVADALYWRFRSSVTWRNTFFRNVGYHSTNDAASDPTRPNPHHSAERTSKGTVSILLAGGKRYVRVTEHRYCGVHFSGRFVVRGTRRWVVNGEWVKTGKERPLYFSNTAQYATLHCKPSQPRFESTLPKGSRQVHRCNSAFYTMSNLFTLTTHQTDTPSLRHLSRSGSSPTSRILRKSPVSVHVRYSSPWHRSWRPTVPNECTRKVQFTLGQVVKAQRGSRGIALPFLQLRR